MANSRIPAVIRKGTNLLKLGRAFVRLVQDPTRLDEVFDMADAMDRNPEIIRPIRQAFEATELGARGLAERPRVRIDMASFEAMAEGTLGRAFAGFVRREGIDPTTLFRDRRVESVEEWIFEHLFETHDIWHVVTGFGTDVAGELGLQAFYLSQFPARLASLLLGTGLLNTFLFGFDDRERRMTEIAKGWTMGTQAQRIIGVDWNALWATDLTEIRQRFGIAEASRAKVALAA